jgi:chitin synthase
VFYISPPDKVILTSSLEDPDFGMTGIAYFNSVVQVSVIQLTWLMSNAALMDQYIMTSVVVACFLFSMGNKPYAYVTTLVLLTSLSPELAYYRSKWKYKLTAIFLGTLMVYMIFASTKCAIKAASQGGAANNVMLLSVIVTFGCKQIFSLDFALKNLATSVYFFSSFLALDPWQLLTSFVPYMLLVPTYINILNM